MIYNAITRRCFGTVTCAGAAAGPGWFRGEAGGRAQGTWVQFDVEIAAGEPLIRGARFLAFGCPHVIAVAQWLAERAAGLPALPQLPESVKALQQRFEVPTEKLGRLLVIEDAWSAALRHASLKTASTPQK